MDFCYLNCLAGLAKLEEASQTVELLKDELNIMEQHLREANKKAEEVLLEVTQRAKESEKIKESVSKVKDRAEQVCAENFLDYLEQLLTFPNSIDCQTNWY